MALIPRWRKILQITLISLFVFVGMIAIYVPVQQHILRWRAEQLLADIRDLQLGKSTWDDAQSIMNRWGAWGQYEGVCSEKLCSYQINLPDLSARFAASLPKSFIPRLFPLYRTLGGRCGFALARIEVVDGRIWGKDYTLLVDVPLVDSPDGSSYLLTASANTVWRTEDFHGEINAQHAEYRIGHPGGCEGCMAVYARFTPFTDSETVNDFFIFNLDCITRRNPCRDQMDIMPSVWKRVLAEEAKRDHNSVSMPGVNRACWQTPEFLGRDEENVVIAEVAATQPVQDYGGPMTEVNFYLVDRLKRASFWIADARYKVMIDNAAIKTREHPERLDLKRGAKFILTFPAPSQLPPYNWLDINACNILQLTDAALAAVRQGMSRDIFPATRSRWP